MLQNFYRICLMSSYSLSEQDIMIRPLFHIGTTQSYASPASWKQSCCDRPSRLCYVARPALLHGHCCTTWGWMWTKNGTWSGRKGSFASAIGFWASCLGLLFGGSKAKTNLYTENMSHYSHNQYIQCRAAEAKLLQQSKPQILTFNRNHQNSKWNISSFD